MEENPFIVIRENQINIETRDEELRKRLKTLRELVLVQNEKFEKLRKGYFKLGLVDKEPKEYFEPMLRNTFEKELKILGERFELINNNPKTNEEKSNTHKELEKYIIDSIELFGRRWNTIIAYMNLWTKERSEFRKKELELEKEYITLGSFDNVEGNPDWIETADKLYNKHIPLIEEQKKRLSGEEELQNELESILKFREQLFNLAEQLFVL